MEKLPDTSNFIMKSPSKYGVRPHGATPTFGREPAPQRGRVTARNASMLTRPRGTPAARSRTCGGGRSGGSRRRAGWRQPVGAQGSAAPLRRHEIDLAADQRVPPGAGSPASAEALCGRRERQIPGRSARRSMDMPSLARKVDVDVDRPGSCPRETRYQRAASTPILPASHRGRRRRRAVGRLPRLGLPRRCGRAGQISASSQLRVVADDRGTAEPWDVAMVVGSRT